MEMPQLIHSIFSVTRFTNSSQLYYVGGYNHSGRCVLLHNEIQ